MKINNQILFVGSQFLKDSIKLKIFDQLKESLSNRNYKITITSSITEGMLYIKQSPNTSGIGIYWDKNNPQMSTELEEIVTLIRSRNENVPIFIFSDENVTQDIPIAALKEINEYVYLYSETPEFTANRIDRAIHQYYQYLLPPYFKTLKNFVEGGDYYWDCPGHMAGAAYLKHPVGVEFYKFYGENIFRSDIGVATAEMGDYLIHAGPPKKSEEIAAELFGADWTFYALAGSSGSNRIVTQGAVGAGEIAVVDRNCHKSLNHALTLSQARPVYLKPTRNGYGLIGPIPKSRLEKPSIDALIQNSDVAKKSESLAPTYAVVTNCTYDGFIYNVNNVIDALSPSVPRIHFDEAWYAYAKFHPLYQGRFAMGADEKPNMPTLFAVQSTHKMLPALSMASMIHVKKSERAPLDFDDFNDAFMMHGTTSPFYPIIASMDVAVNMMKGNAGKSLVEESIDESIEFRKAVIQIKDELKKEDESSWFFDVLQPTMVIDPETGIEYRFRDAPMALLSQKASSWTLKAGETWHGFKDEDVADNDFMLDPVKVTITCPGILPDGTHEKMGIPGSIVSKFLDDRRTEVARTGDYSLLILFSVGTTKGKWGNLIESLLEFKKHYDKGSIAADAIPSLKGVSPQYETMTLKELCQSMHDKVCELELMEHSSKAVSINPEAVMTPAEAYQKVVRYKAEHIKLDDFEGRISASMLTPYPPGIPVLMPGERLPEGDAGIMGYLKALQTIDQLFPGFEHEMQGVNVDEDGEYWVRAIIEDDSSVKTSPSVTFRRKVSSAVKKGRQ